MLRSVSITEHDDGTVTVQIKPQYVEYPFDNLNDAIAALSSLPELTRE